jgi:hypothetical protein
MKLQTGRYGAQYSGAEVIDLVGVVAIGTQVAACIAQHGGTGQLMPLETR